MGILRIQPLGVWMLNFNKAKEQQKKEKRVYRRFWRDISINPHCYMLCARPS